MSYRSGPDPRPQAAAMLAALERDHPGAAERLHCDALAELGEWSEIQIRYVGEVRADSGGPGSRCSVAGSYRPERTPPVLEVTRSASTRRRHFTALHELGHHLQQNDEDLGEAALSVPNSMAFEDAACDTFAARILLPDALVANAIGPRGPAVDDVVRLFEESNASRAACCVRAAEHLAGAGAVVLYEPDGTVNFAAARGLFPPARGSDQSGTVLIGAALAQRGRSGAVTRNTQVLYRNGSTSDQLYGQAAWCDGYLVAVLAADTAAWLSFSPPMTGTSRYAGPEQVDCDTCGEEYEAVDRCSTCGSSRCPRNHCSCTAKRERTCTRCWSKWATNRFPNDGDVCADCA